MPERAESRRSWGWGKKHKAAKWKKITEKKSMKLAVCFVCLERLIKLITPSRRLTSLQLIWFIVSVAQIQSIYFEAPIC